jgi:hypothetical protein
MIVAASHIVGEKAMPYLHTSSTRLGLTRASNMLHLAIGRQMAEYIEMVIHRSLV